jgi:hypothetical protein
LSKKATRKKTPLWRSIKAHLLLWVTIAVAVVFLCLVPIDVTSMSPSIKKQVSKMTNSRIEMGQVSLYVLPFPRATITDFTLNNFTEDIIIAKTAKARISLTALLYKHLEIKDLSLESAKIIVRRDKDGIINLSKLRKNKIFVLSLAALRLKDTEIIVTDDMGGESTRYEALAKNAYFSRSSDNISYAMNGRLMPETLFDISGSARRAAKDKWELSGTLGFKQLDFEDILPFIKKDTLTGANVSISGKLSLDSIYSYTGKNPFESEDFFLSLTTGTGLIKGSFSSKAVTFNLPNIINEPVNSEEASSEFELSWNNNSQLLTLTESSLKIDGLWAKGSLKLALPLKTVELELNAAPAPAKELQIILTRLRLPEKIKDFTESFKDITGLIELNKLSLKTAQANEAIEADESGKAASVSIDIDTLSIDASLEDIGFRQKELKSSVSQVSGKLMLSNDTLTSSELKGRYGDIQINSLDINLNNIYETPDFNIRLDASGDAKKIKEELKRYVRSKTLDELLLKGAIKLRLEFEGLAKKNSLILIKTRLELKDTAIEYKEFLSKSFGYPAAFEGIAKLHGKTITIGYGAGIFKDSRIDLAAKDIEFSDKERPSYQLELLTNKLDIKDLVDLSPYLGGANSRGSVTLEFTARKDAKDKTPFYNGEIRIEGGLFKTRYLKKTVRDLHATAELNGNKGILMLDSLKVGRSSLSGTVKIIDISLGIIDFDLLAEELHTTDILPEDFSAITTPKEAEKLPLITGIGKILVKKGTIGKTSFESLSAEVYINKRVARLAPIRLRTNNGEITGSLRYNRLKSEPVLFTSEATASRVDVRSFLEELGVKKEVLTGNLTAKMTLTGKRGYKPITRGIDGEVLLNITGGRLQRFVVLSKIFSIINIISINELFEEGLPYEMISGEFSINNGVITTEDFVLNSNSLRISSIGEIDFTKKTIDATLGLHPFVTIDKIVSMVPVAGWILIGEEGTINMYYELTGPLKEIDINPIPVKGIGKNVIGIFKRILTSPLKIIEPLQEQREELKKDEAQ